MDVSRAQVLRYRHHRHELSLDEGRADAAILDLGVQDTGGPAAARWALGNRGADVDEADLLHAWTLRGAPHAYRRSEAAQVAAATAPYDEADAAKRVFDASKPLTAAGIEVMQALDVVAGHLRDIVVEPTVKGDASGALTERLPEAYLRSCRPCKAIHIYEQPFRLAALRAGLELEPETSPPVLRRIPGWSGPAAAVPAHLDVLRAVLRFHGPTTPRLVADLIEAPVRVVKARWPDDVAEVRLEGERRWLLVEDLEALGDPPEASGMRLLGAFDPWLQTRDRPLLVPDEGRRKDVWRILGRPGVVLEGAEAVGTWRPRSSGAQLRLQIRRWDGGEADRALEEQAELLAAHRGQRFAGWSDDAPT